MNAQRERGIEEAAYKLISLLRNLPYGTFSARIEAAKLAQAELSSWYELGLEDGAEAERADGRPVGAGR